MRTRDQLAQFIATGAYIGYLPWAPGTWGSLLGFLISLLLASLSLPIYGMALGSCIVLGVWSAGKAERLLGQKDAAPIVIDEIAGMLLTYTAIPMTLFPLMAGFVLFRLFDILKPLPQLERLPGGWGIVLDDLVAGGLAHLGIRFLLRLLGSPET